MDPAKDKLTKLLKGIYGDEWIDDWVKSGKTVRQIFELSKPTTQCNNTISSSTGKKCWLCGIAFDETLPALKPVCEHVLPIAQAVFFLQLYSNRESRDQDIPEVMREEYDWAHQYCNLKKSDQVFIKESSKSVNDFNLYEVDSTGVDNFIIQLKDGQTSLDGAKSIRDHVTANKINIKEKIVERLNRIVTFINKPIGEGFGGLAILARSASLRNPTNRNKGFESPPSKRTRIGGRKKRTKRIRRTRRNKL